MKKNTYILLNILWNITGYSICYLFLVGPFDLIYATFKKGAFDRWRLSAYFAPFDINCEWKKRFPYVEYPKNDELPYISFVRLVLKKLGYKIVTKRNYNYQLIAFLAQKSVDNKYENVCVLCMKHTRGSSFTATIEANQAKKDYNCNKSILVTCSTFTPEAIRLAEYDGVVLWDKQKLNYLFKKLRLPYRLTENDNYCETKKTNYYKNTNYEDDEYEEDDDSLTYEEIDNFDILDE